MKLKVNFSETNQSVTPKFAENNSTLDTDVGELSVIHDGQNGATFFPTVSPEGVISWTNDRELDNPKPVSIKGEDGYTPIKGKDYFDGKDGYTPVKGVDYFDGEDGNDGYTPIKGVDYFDGADDKTPVKGTDYFTPADVSEMVQAVVNALPVYDGEVIAE